MIYLILFKKKELSIPGNTRCPEIPEDFKNFLTIVSESHNKVTVLTCCAASLLFTPLDCCLFGRMLFFLDDLLDVCFLLELMIRAPRSHVPVRFVERGLDFVD